MLPIQVAVAKKNKKGAQEVVSKPPDLEEEARKKVDAFCPESFYWGTPSNKNAQSLKGIWILVICFPCGVNNCSHKVQEESLCNCENTCAAGRRGGTWNYNGHESTQENWWLQGPFTETWPQDNTTNMAKALSATNFPEWKGEVDAETKLASKCAKTPCIA